MLSAREARINMENEEPRAIVIPRGLLDEHGPQKELEDHRTDTVSTGTNNEKE